MILLVARKTSYEIAEIEQVLVSQYGIIEEEEKEDDDEKEMAGMSIKHNTSREW